jgi:hypothetical protein
MASSDADSGPLVGGKNSFDSHCGHPFEIDGQRLDHFGGHARLRATRKWRPCATEVFQAKVIVLRL